MSDIKYNIILQVCILVSFSLPSRPLHVYFQEKQQVFPAGFAAQSYFPASKFRLRHDLLVRDEEFAK